MDRRQEVNRLEAYGTLLRTEAGQIILNDLKTRYLHHSVVGVTSDNNAMGMAYSLGQKELILAIMRWAEADPMESTKHLEELYGDGAE